MKKLICFALVAYVVLFAAINNSFAQSNINLSLGYKTVEIGLTKTLDSEIILGGSFSLTNSKVIEDRINSVDVNYIHTFNSKYTPTIFGLLGAKFDRLNMIGKVGASYVDQNINTVKDDKHLYLAVGIQLIYEVSNSFGISGSFDNVNSFMAGINYKIN